ncbi:MAG TPA: DUF4296 domain-containing protein, partial [Dyadobacter sp.]|nr:DUF4296 domain-containing protein [Dyadobacter sp.]
KRTMDFSFVSLVFILGLLAVAGCSDNSKPPEDVLSQEEMAAILTDIHIAEARITKLQLRSSDSSLMVFDTLKKQIWNKHKVDTLAYRISYDYYMTNPRQMSGIYEKVNKKIEAREKDKNIKP